MAPLKRLSVVHTCFFSVAKNKNFRTTFFSGFFFRYILYGCFPVAFGYTNTAFLGLGVLLSVHYVAARPILRAHQLLSASLCCCYTALPYSAALCRTVRALLCSSRSLSLSVALPYSAALCRIVRVCCASAALSLSAALPYSTALCRIVRAMLCRVALCRILLFC